MYKKILYPTDFSDVSEKALNFIKQLKNAGAHEVIVLHVIDIRGLELVNKHISTHFLEDAANYFLEMENNQKEVISNRMNSIEKELTEEGFIVKLSVVEGIPFNEILKAEEEANVSLTVIGSHGVSNVEEMLLGSVSEKVIRKAKKPVFVVKR